MMISISSEMSAPLRRFNDLVHRAFYLYFNLKRDVRSFATGGCLAPPGERAEGLLCEAQRFWGLV